jgi:hypothetical protein
MNLLYVSLGVALVLSAISFLVASKTAPLVLLGTSTVLLIYAHAIHSKQYQADYKYSTWQAGLRPLAPLVLVGVVIMLAYGYFAMTSESFTVGGSRRIGRR